MSGKSQSESDSVQDQDFTQDKKWVQKTLNSKTIFYIGIINTLLLVSIGSVITYIAAVAQSGGTAVISSSLFGVCAAICMYYFTTNYGPSQKSQLQDSITSVLSGSVVISTLPLFVTDILQIMNGTLLTVFIIGLIVVISCVVGINRYVILESTIEDEGL